MSCSTSSHTSIVQKLMPTLLFTCGNLLLYCQASLVEEVVEVAVEVSKVDNKLVLLGVLIYVL
jgi:hypothetical protein